jgi:hypothetical protein
VCGPEADEEVTETVAELDEENDVGEKVDEEELAEEDERKESEEVEDDDDEDEVSAAVVVDAEFSTGEGLVVYNHKTKSKSILAKKKKERSKTSSRITVVSTCVVCCMR